MDYMELVKTVVTSAIFIGAITWLARTYVQTSFSKDLERHKSDLEQELFKFKTKYQSLHTSRADVIEKIFQYLVKTEKYFRHVVDPIQDRCKKNPQEKEEELVNLLIEFRNFYDKNELYFPKETAKKMDLMFKTIWEIWGDWSLLKEYRLSKDTTSEQVKLWIETWNKVKNEIPAIKLEIMSEFRNLIGVE